MAGDGEPLDGPFRSFPFRLKWRGRSVAAFTEVTGVALPAATGEAGSRATRPTSLRGQNEFTAIVLKRGLTGDAAFMSWCHLLRDHSGEEGASGVDGSVADLREDLVLEVHDPDGHKRLGFILRRCWASRFSAMPELDADSSLLAIDSLMLENEGWQAEPAHPEPTDPVP